MSKHPWKVPSGQAVPLTDDERKTAAEVRSLLNSVTTKVRAFERIEPATLSDLSRLAHKLHMSLRKHGHEPKHTKIMVENRGLQPTHPAFYNHVHPVEDLIAFLDNEHANDDAVDLTIGAHFEFEVHSRRWGSRDVYRVTRTLKGWTFENPQPLEADRDARVAGKDGTGLFHFLDHDGINYPHELPGYFEWLWEQALERGLTPEEVQVALTDLAGWVSMCEQRTPIGVFAGFK